MKKLCLILILFSYFNSYSQDYKGVWLYDSHKSQEMNFANRTGDSVVVNDVDQTAFDKTVYTLPYIKGVVLNLSWDLLQPNSWYEFNWTDYFDKAINDIIIAPRTTPLKIGISIWTGKNAPGWLDDAAGSTNNNKHVETFYVPGDGYYPDYLGLQGKQNSYTYSKGVNENDPILDITNYESLWRNMIEHVIARIDAKYNEINSGWNNILFIQSAEGTTGDLAPYHGSGEPNQPYRIENNDKKDINGQFVNNGGNSEWQKFVKRCWTFTADKMSHASNAFKTNVKLLLNTGAPTDVFGNANFDNPTFSTTYFNSVWDQSIFYWVTHSDYNDATTKTFMAKSWRKSDGTGHWYQLNYEPYFRKAFADLKLTDATICTRDEFDLAKFTEKDENDNFIKPIGSTAANLSNIYATAASALNADLDLWCIPYPQFANTLNAEIFNMFNALKQIKILPDNSTGAGLSLSAYCFLKDGLDANDFNRFIPPLNLSQYGCTPNPTFDKDRLTENCGEKWCSNLVNTSWVPYQSNGAVQNDKTYAQSAPSRQYLGVNDYNDVGWYTFTTRIDGSTPASYGNFEKFMTQKNPETSLGKWSHGSANTYGRFSRIITGKTTSTNALYFDVTYNNLSNNVSLSGTKYYQINVIYYDNADGGIWQLGYTDDQGNVKTPPLWKVTSGTSSPAWKIVTFSQGTCFHLNDKSLNSSDFFIKSSDDLSHEFAFVSVTITSSTNPGCTTIVSNPTTLFPTSLLPKNQSIIYSNNATSDKLKTSLVTVFPNPSRDYTTVTFNDIHTQCNLTLSNMQGKQLYQKTLPRVNKGITEKISLQGFAKGVYFLKISCDDATVQTEKIIVE